MSITERVVDRKRRVTLPPDSNLEEGSTVSVVSSTNTVLITKDPQLAKKLETLIPQIRSKRKLEALEEWESLLKEAGLLGLTSKQIESKVAHSVAKHKPVIR